MSKFDQGKVNSVFNDYRRNAEAGQKSFKTPHFNGIVTGALNTPQQDAENKAARDGHRIGRGNRESRK